MRPMKAYQLTPDLKELKYPLLASPKLDGIRCVIIGGEALSNSLKPIPNATVQQWAKDNALALEALDGELMVDGDFNDVQSTIMSVNGPDTWIFNCFDSFAYPEKPFRDRLNGISLHTPPKTNLVRHIVINNAEELQDYWDVCVSYGHEGVITRAPTGQYKFGRSTLNQGWAVKLKTWIDDEATIVGYYELMHNDNEAFTDALGFTKRASNKGNKIPLGMLGGLVLQWRGVEFRLGSGLSEGERHKLWACKEALIGETCTFKYFGLSKAGIPRHPIWKGVRHD